MHSGSKSQRPILILLGIVIAGFALSLPWQMKQWRALDQARAETRVQEARVAELQRKPEIDRNAALSAPSQIAALQQRASSRGVSVALLNDLSTLSSGNLTPHERAALAGVYQSIEYWDFAYSQAVRAAKEAQSSGTPTADVLLRLGYLEMLLGYRQSALPTFQRAAALDADDPAPLLAVALAYDQAGDLKAAEKSLRKALTLRPDNVEIRVLLGQNLTNQKRTDDALAVLSDAETRAPTNPVIPLQTADTALAEATRNASLRAELLARADSSIERSLQLDPHSAQALVLRGRIRLEQKRIEDARADWETVYARQPGFPRLRYYLGQLYLQSGDKARGQEFLRQFREFGVQETDYGRLVMTVGLNPEDINKRRELAEWSGAHGRLSRAILEYDQILQRRPADTEAKRERDRFVKARAAAIPAS